MQKVAENGDKTQSLSKRTSSFNHLDELKREANELRTSSNADAELKKNLMFEEKDISLFLIFKHLSESKDYFYIILSIIGSIGAGLALPIMANL